MKRDALEFVCPKCGAGVGARCRNYRGRACAPHGGRVPRHVPNVRPLAEYQDAANTRNEVRKAALLAYLEAVAKCGHYQGARYARWRVKDRSGARPDRLIFVVMRPGLAGWRDREGRTVEEIDADGETLGPPFQGFEPMGRGNEAAPYVFPFRWERRFEAIEVPEVTPAEQLHAAAEKRRAKELARQAAEAEQLEAWKMRNETPPLFGEAE